MLSLRRRLARDEAFTLIELLVVLIIIGILLSIAIPSYLGFQRKAQETAAMSDVRSAIPDVEAFYSDSTTGSYTGMTAATLKSTYDSGIKLSASGSDGLVSAIPSATDTQKYCVSAVVGRHWAYIKGPGGDVVNATTASSDPCAGF